MMALRPLWEINVQKALAGGGIFLSTLYVVSTAWLIQDRIVWLQSAPLNEVGDFLAGVFSPLAFLWLVLGFFQQGKELNASREALLLQAAELRSSVEQQKELVGVSKEQLEAEIAARKAEHNRYVRAAQPAISIDRVELSMSDGRIRCGFSMRNTGHQITRVECSWETQARVTLEKRYAVWASGETIDFTITAYPSLVQDFLLSLRFLDGLGAEQNAEYRMIREEKDSFPRFRAVEVFPTGGQTQE
ncbi:membrane protein [Stutzerimonas stutzeri]|nr:membrane protein [Stutzerimonas stutzeri]